MINIVTIKGDQYAFDENTGRIFKDGHLLSSTLCEPVYTNVGGENIPKFSGILMKDTNNIISLSGKINPAVDDLNLIY